MQTVGAQQRISEAERRFLLDGVEQGLRSDGRGPYDCRRVAFEVGTIPTATGSCRLRAGDTDLLVSVMCDVIRPHRERPNEGLFQVAVDCAASATPGMAFSEAGPHEASQQLSAVLDTMCAGPDVIDRTSLCISPGGFAWDVHVDVLVLKSGGNLLDSISLAMCLALRDTLLPKVHVVEAMEEGEQDQIRVDDRPEIGMPFPLSRLPLCVTVAQLQQRFLLDVTWEEELCADAMLCVVVDGKTGDVTGMHKLGRGLFDLAAVPAMLQRCRATAAALVRQLDLEMPAKEDFKD